MFKLITTLVITIFIVVFALLNIHMVHIRFFMGDPIQVPLIFLIFVSILIGAMIPILYSLVKRVNKNKYEIQSTEDILAE